ncbi:hypothetical protein IZU99_04890 [Oscillospiraceae bacterium CM]|nr:hypothetical protein IZU99_04890 [Oscillospiraceae bacterium CM]
MGFRSVVSGSLDGIFKLYKRCVKLKTKYAHRIKTNSWCRKNRHKLTAAQLNEAKDYWRRFTKEYSANFCKRFSTVNGTFDVRYIPEDLYFNIIEPYLNNHQQTFGNKSYFPMMFDCKMPEIVFSRVNGIYLSPSFELITEEEALRRCFGYDAVIFKPSVDSCGGKNVKIFETGDPSGIRKAFDEYSGFPYYVVQNVIRQHAKISAIHSASVNTIRIMTLLINGKIVILPPVLRMGVNNSRVDNASSGGIVCGILPDGRLKACAYSAAGVRFDRHPQGFEFGKGHIPSIDAAEEMVRRIAQKFPDHRLIAWDIAIDEDGEPILIEANVNHGQIDFMQFNNGPLFGDYTDDVLKEVFQKK